MQTSGATSTSLTWPFIPTHRKISSGTTQYYIILSTLLFFAYRIAAAKHNCFNDFLWKFLMFLLDIFHKMMLAIGLMTENELSL